MIWRACASDKSEHHDFFNTESNIKLYESIFFSRVVHGDRVEYRLNGLLHRSGNGGSGSGCNNDLPAIVRANGSKEWWINGRRHRDNGLPAIVRVNGTQEYYNNGRKPDII